MSTQPSNPRAGWVRSDELIEIANDYNSDIEIQEKLIYYKFIHLSNQSSSTTPVYQKYVKRLDKVIDVYDEYLTFRISTFSKLVKKFKSYDSTKGTAIEVNSLLPFILSLRDTDKTAEANPQMIQPVIYGPSNVFVTSSHYYNGFQTGNKDAAVKADKNVQTIRLLVDFTSVKDHSLFISQNPQVYFSFHDSNHKGKIVSKNIGDAEMILPGLFYAEKTNVQEGEVVRIEFASDFDTVSNLS